MKNPFIIISQSSKIHDKENHYHQLALPLELPQKPQISSIPGISPKEPHRYRVVLGGQVLGDRAKCHPHLGKYFPRLWLGVNEGGQQ
jgi:hypothetical protein